jgi:hypothetical protein
MNVYRLLPDNDHFHNFALVNQADNDVFHRSDGTSLGGAWKPLAITAADTDDELAHLADHALLGTIPVVSERAVERVGVLLASSGELLPLTYGRGRYFAYNVTQIVDALDESRSEVRRFSSGRVMSIDRYFFHSERLRDAVIFKISQLSRAFVFSTDRFVDAVRHAGLTGFTFEKVWGSDI